MPNRPLTAQDIAALATNRAHWESVSDEHLTSDYYPVTSVLEGASSLTPIEENEIGDIRALRGLHLQCGIGLDTISLQRLGANMIGVDFAERAIEIAQALAARTGQTCTFIVDDAVALTKLSDATFDFAYASNGVLRWIPRLDIWANQCVRKLRIGGFLYLFEVHPLLFRLRHIRNARALLRGDYFDETGVTKTLAHTHVGALPATPVQPTVTHYNWTISSVLNSLLAVGFSLDFYREHAVSSYSRKGLLHTTGAGLYRPLGHATPLPLSYSVRAVRCK